MTRSYIAKEIGENQYRMIYCHSDGYLTHNGAILVDHYNTPEAVDELLDLGDLSVLAERPNPDMSKPHSFDYNCRQEGVVVAYGRDRGETNVEARICDMRKLNDCGIDYVYIFTKENEWKHFEPRDFCIELRDVKDDLDSIYQKHGISRPIGLYGFENAVVQEAKNVLF